MPHHLAWRNLHFSTAATKKHPSRTILASACGYACAGDSHEGGVVALMGASGSGKTTLLTLLAAHSSPDSGDLKLDSRTYDSTSAGFVPQQDHLFGTLTVLEQVKFGSALRGARRSPSDVNAVDDARLSACLAQLGLSHLESSRIGEPNATGRHRGISGGERKRVALALELLYSPPLLILVRSSRCGIRTRDLPATASPASQSEPSCRQGAHTYAYTYMRPQSEPSCLGSPSVPRVCACVCVCVHVRVHACTHRRLFVLALTLGASSLPRCHLRMSRRQAWTRGHAYTYIRMHIHTCHLRMSRLQAWTRGQRWT